MSDAETGLGETDSLVIADPSFELVVDPAENVVEPSGLVVVEPPHTSSEIHRSAGDIAGVDRGDVVPNGLVVRLLAQHVLTYRQDVRQAVQYDGLGLVEAPHHVGEP